MDADTRHQLKTNELVQLLSRIDLSDRRLWYWIVGVGLVVVLYFGWKLRNWQARAALDLEWQSLRSLDTSTKHGDAPLEQLRRLISENSDPRVVAAARLRLGNALFERAGENTAESSSYLDEAVRELAAVAESADVPPAMPAAALFKLGKVYETRREFDQARQVYERLRDDSRFEGVPFRELAADRLELLDKLAARIELQPGLAPLPPPASKPASAPSASSPHAAPQPSLPTSAPASEYERREQPAATPSKPVEQQPTGQEARGSEAPPPASSPAEPSQP